MQMTPSDTSSQVETRTIFICRGTGCQSAQAVELQERLQQAIRAAELDGVIVKFTGCHGFCEKGPIAIVEPDGVFYNKVTVEDADDIVGEHLVNGQIVERLLYRDPVTDELVRHYQDITFYNRQSRQVLHNCGHINPEEIQEYLATGGYEALRTVLTEMTPEDVVGEVKRSGLRGRGGAGFPAGLKWDFCRKSPGDKKYVIGNADEGDPGAFMNRSLLEGDPHSVIEGMTICAFAIGSSTGYVYCRAEYPLAIRRLRIALEQAREAGFLGENILDSGFAFDIILKEGAGAFVCGEETALMASIEGKRGMPRPRPPFPAQSGLWGKPTNINNVETLGNVPLIIRHGADWFTGFGTEKSKGTKTFALTGKIANSGLVEVPLGTPLREIIFEIGGGIPNDRKFKAAQTGGPSGGCIPSSMLDIAVDYESLAEAGSIMGSGGLVVMDEDNCMVDVARFFLSFTQDESCGKCIPCRLGTKRMLEILERITRGEGQEGDVELLLELCETVKVGSLCGLGQTAPNPVLTTIRYFRDEYEAHIRDHRCPAGVCAALITYKISEDNCTGCTVCARKCPVDAITGERKQVHVIDPDLCTRCDTCRQVCRFDAVYVE
jgi:NADH:ubiquinone oxidoreductase subunit F (NADH-binding)/(2Fe-2S) ferredoxin/NAD-dependent dihydropyrimidine dehydrogenase PreA subunit